ncbi:hypothetical protein, partial [Chitinophaga deserti]|uniref:hypothetical protein n=1 Tax=Chitinophaga deserti TaxID=2164099 RepID=UPI001E4450F4
YPEAVFESPEVLKIRFALKGNCIIRQEQDTSVISGSCIRIAGGIEDKICFKRQLHHQTGTRYIGYIRKLYSNRRRY